MNFSNENTGKKLTLQKNEYKSNYFNDFNKQLDYILNNDPTYRDKTNQTNKNNKIIENKKNKDKLILNPIEELTYKRFENFEILNKEKEMQKKRLDVLKLFDDDSLSHFFSIDNNNNYLNYKIDYAEEFNDNNLQKESIFYFASNDNKNEKSKLIKLEDIKELKKNEIHLNFGEEPLNIYNKIINSKNREKEYNLRLFANYLSNLNKFKIQDPNIELKENKLIYINDETNSYSSNNKNEYSLFNNNMDNNYLSQNDNRNILINPTQIKENPNNLIIPLMGNKISNLNYEQNSYSYSNETLKKPVLIEKYEYSLDNQNKINKNKYINNKLYDSIIKEEMANKYNVNIKEKEKVDELIKENTFEYKHKKNLLKRGKIFKKE